MWLSVAQQVWLLLLGALTFVYWYLRNQYLFWAKLGVPFRKPHWFFGSAKDWVLSKICMAELLQNFYQEFRSERFFGIWGFLAPILIVIDPELIRHILVKDSEVWSSRGKPVELEHDPLSSNLLYLSGDEWKSMRSNSSPAYTPGKLKQMFQILLECGKDLEKHLNAQLTVDDGVIEASEMCRKFVTDVNGLSTLGIKFNSLNEDNLFHRKLKEDIFEPSFKRKIGLAISLGFNCFFDFLEPSEHSQEMTDLFLNMVKENLEYRDKNNIQKHDFLDSLRGLQSVGKPPAEVEAKLLAGQLFDFFVGGLESGSRVISHALHELAVNQDIQDRLREEVRRTKAADNGETTWDAMNSMQYLDMVVQETMRKYPVTLLFRMSVKPYRIPGTNVEVPSDTMCYIPTYAIHHDPEYYPDPEKFDPERFTNEAKSQRPACTFLPFGAGPRNCIGLRFGEHQVKVALITIVHNFKISQCERSQNPLEFDPEDIFLSAKDGIWLRFSKNSSNEQTDC